MTMISDRVFRFGLALAALSLLSLPQMLRAAEKVPVKVEKPESFKGLSQVVIGQFTVAFFTKKVDYDGGGFASVSDKGKAIGHLSGVSPAEFQATTDAIYADFLKQLAARNIAVVDGAAMTAGKYYAKVKTEAQGEKIDVVLKKQDKADAMAYWPTALGRNNNVLVPMRMMDMSMGHMYTAEYDYARTAKVPVLNVIYFVDFAKPAKSSGGGLFQTLDVKAGLAISPFGTQMGLMDTNGKMAKILLVQPIEEGGDFANINETTSAVTKGMRTAGMLAGAFGGLKGLGNKNLAGDLSARFDYAVVDPATYAQKTISAAGKTSDLMIRQIEALR